MVETGSSDFKCVALSRSSSLTYSVVSFMEDGQINILNLDIYCLQKKENLLLAILRLVKSNIMNLRDYAVKSI